MSRPCLVASQLSLGDVGLWLLSLGEHLHHAHGCVTLTACCSPGVVLSLIGCSPPLLRSPSSLGCNPYPTTLQAGSSERVSCLSDITQVAQARARSQTQAAHPTKLRLLPVTLLLIVTEETEGVRGRKREDRSLLSSSVSHPNSLLTRLVKAI